MKVEEVNFDRLVGPTHHYGGYSYGNVASMEHTHQPSHPKQAALEGLRKMKLLLDAQVSQAVLPPPMRPSLSTLRALGFKGSDAHIFEKVAKESPHLLALISSSAFMWAANSATFSPSTDTEDRRAHLTIANLNAYFHRSIESSETYQLFQRIFHEDSLFALHPPLPSGGDLGDEGAANHLRLCSSYGERGMHLFVYGKSIMEAKRGKFPIRQAKEASQAIARQHGLDPNTTFFVQQNPEAIEAGVFHNDMIAASNQNVFLFHEKAYVDAEETLMRMQHCCPLKIICVTENMLPLKEALKNYFFNNQLVTLSDGSSLMILPQKCAGLDLEWLPMKKVFVNLDESMQGGGGPACLRLRCVLNEKEKHALPSSLLLNNALYGQLVDWVKTHYRETLTMEDLGDPALLRESQEALDTLTQILQLGSFYEFQREIGSHT